MITKKILCTPVTFGGSTEKGKPYSNFKEVIKSELKEHIDNEINLKIELFIEQSRIKEGKNDLDNFLKPIIDSLDESNTINTESQISSIFIKRNKVTDKKEEGVIIEINPVQT
ncbi:MAG: RusA family crossover junction endodeoxyribonuclease [archaeon]